MRHVHGLWPSVAVLFAMAGCMFVSPLDDLPAAGAGATSSGGGEPGGSGGSAQGGVHDGGDPGTSGSAGTGNQGTGGGTKPVDGPCETNAECVERFAEQPARCRPSDQRCVPLTTDVCPLAYGKFQDPNAIFFGAFTTFDPAALEDNSISWAHQLALDELSGDNLGGLPDGPDGLRRPLVMSLCSNLTEDVDAAMRHLVEELEVPAVLATLRPGDLRRAYDNYIDREILYLSPVSVTQTLVNQDKKNLIWNLLGKPTDLAPPYRPLLAKTEAFIRDERALPGSTPLRVALVTTREAFDAELGAAVPGLLQFNGKSVEENGENYRGFEIQRGLSDAELTKAAWDVIEFRPHVIISTASDVLSREGGLLGIVEMDWGLADLAGTPDEKEFRPQWILSPFNAGDLEWLRAAIKGNIASIGRGMEQRFVGISIAGPTDTTLQKSYQTRLRTSFRNAYLDSANYYDALYYLAYGMYGAGTAEPLTGPAIARGLGRLLEGTSFNVGPLAISEVLDELETPTNTVHVASTLGPPDFDPETGVRPVEGSVFCFHPKEGDVTVRTDVLRYDAAKQELVGNEFPCFAGFLQ